MSEPTKDATTTTTTTTPKAAAAVSESTKKKHNYEKYVKKYMNVLFKDDYERREAYYVLLGAVIIAINTGFVNGVSMSPSFLEASESADKFRDEVNPLKVNPATQGISGTGGSFTKSARYLVEADWPNYSYITLLILSYIFGAFLAGIITPRAHKYICEPLYGPTFLLAALMLLAASLLATYDQPSRFIFYFATAALGVQNGITSIYSANLIRCTLTGTSTDLGLIFAQALRGNFEKFIRGTLIAIIVTNYWIGGILSVPIVEALHQRAMYVSVGFFALLGVMCIRYTMSELGVSITEAIFGTWNWKDVLEVLFEDHEGDLKEEDFLHLFDHLDEDGNGLLELEELQAGIKKSKKIQMSNFRIKALMRAADVNHDDCIDRDEWKELAQKIVKTEKGA